MIVFTRNSSLTNNIKYISLFLFLVRSSRFSTAICNVRQEDVPQEYTTRRKKNLVLQITLEQRYNFKRDKSEVDNLQKWPHAVICLCFINHRFTYTQRRPETELHLLYTRFGLVLGILDMTSKRENNLQYRQTKEHQSIKSGNKERLLFMRSVKYEPDRRTFL